MIIVRIETDIAPPCAPRQLLSYKAAGIFLHKRPLVETLAGAFGYGSARRRSAGLMCRMLQSAKRLSVLGWPAPRS